MNQEQVQTAEQTHIAELRLKVENAWADAEQVAAQSEAIHARLIDLYAAAIKRWSKANQELARIELLNNLAASDVPTQ